MVPIKYQEVEKDLETFSIWDSEGNEYPGMITQFRITGDSIPNGHHMYQIRHSDDDDSIPCSLEESVGVNFFGTFISKKEVPLKDGWASAPYMWIKDWSYTGGRLT